MNARKWLLAGSLLAFAGPATAPAADVGDKAPEIDAGKWYNVDTNVSMAKLRGKVVLIDFWATW